MEIWKEIQGYPDRYEISSFGLVRSKNNPRRPNENRILVPTNAGKYLQVTLLRESVSVRVRIHQLVARAFIPNPCNKNQINHIDGNPHNNNLNNLEWCTPSENAIHAIKTGLRKIFPSGPQSETHRMNISKTRIKKPVIKLTKQGQFVKEYESISYAETQTGVFKTHISACAKGKRKSAGGFIWKFKSEQA